MRWGSSERESALVDSASSRWWRSARFTAVTSSMTLTTRSGSPAPSRSTVTLFSSQRSSPVALTTLRTSRGSGSGSPASARKAGIAEIGTGAPASS